MHCGQDLCCTPNSQLYPEPDCEVFNSLHTSPTLLVQYFSGTHLKGVGSAHTRAGQVWPLALMVQGLTASTPEERAEMLRLLLKTQCNNGLMHESGKAKMRVGAAALLQACKLAVHSIMFALSIALCCLLCSERK